MIMRSTLRSQIATALRDEVLAGRLPPGRQFTVKEIAEQYGVSATPVREALVDLAAQGLLDVEQHRGFRVHEYSLDDLRHMVQARALVTEGAFCRDVGQAPVGGADFASVRRRAQAARRAALGGDIDVLVAYDLRFWRELGALVGNNPCIAGFLDRLRIQCWVCAVPHLRRRPGLSGRLWSGHCELVTAAERRDLAAVQRIVAEYDAHWLALIDKLAG